MDQNPALITDDTMVFGFLLEILGLVFYTSNLNNAYSKKFLQGILVVS